MSKVIGNRDDCFLVIYLIELNNLFDFREKCSSCLLCIEFFLFSLAIHIEIQQIFVILWWAGGEFGLLRYKL
jgi:hypothetical protein